MRLVDSHFVSFWTVQRHGRWYMTPVSKSRLGALRESSDGYPSTYIHTQVFGRVPKIKLMNFIQVKGLIYDL